MKFHKPCTAKLLLVLTVATCLAPALCAKVTVSPLFADNAVIQRDAEVPVWGRAAAGEAVTVVFAGQTQTTVADAGGNWEVRLAPLKAGVKGPLTIRGKNVVTMKNVVTGDVWLCSGQSNMGLKVSAVTNAPAEIAAGNFPDIRQMIVPNTPAAEPQPDTFIKAGWVPAPRPPATSRRPAIFSRGKSTLNWACRWA